jgi:hypothetical protein
MKAILMAVRDEEAKRIRRKLGDKGGIKFRHGTYQARSEHSNALTSVVKDNLLMELYEDDTELES